MEYRGWRGAKGGKLVREGGIASYVDDVNTVWVRREARSRGERERRKRRREEDEGRDRGQRPVRDGRQIGLGR